MNKTYILIEYPASGKLFNAEKVSGGTLDDESIVISLPERQFPHFFDFVIP